MSRRAVLDAALLAIVVAVAAFLRFDRLGLPSYWLDEILHQQLTTKAAAEPWWRWVRALHDEHGSLYYLTQLATRLFGTSEAWGRSAAALFGVATIPVLWLASREGRVAAVLLAVSPLHVYYSREARGYALLMLLTAVLIFVLLRARSFLALCLALAAMLYTAAVAAPVVASAMVVAAACALKTRERWYWRAVAACAVTLLLFRFVYAANPVDDPSWPGFPGLTATFFDSLLRIFTVSAFGLGGKLAIAFALVLFALIGAVALVRKNAEHAMVIIGMTILPLSAAIVSLRVFDHFFAARYVTPALIGFVLLVAAGIVAIARWELAAFAVAIVIATQTWAAARAEPFQKLDWRGIAATIWRHAKPTELIVAAEPWSEISLRHYLEQLPERAKLVHIFAPDVAAIQRDVRSGIWLVTAGYNANPAVRHWSCRYPLLLASPLETFRLHYASSRVTGNGTVFFTDGWADPEGAFRWANAKRATVTIPRWAQFDETIRMRVLPFAHPSLALQTMRVSLNGHVLGEVTLPHAWTEQSFAAPSRFWIDGENTLAFDFGHAVAPSSVDPDATDHRTLAVQFEWLRTSAPLARIAAPIEKRHEETRFPPQRLDRDAVERLIIRLGFDPADVWPRLARGEIHLDDVIETLTWGPDCYDDRQFLDTAFAVLLERAPAPHELRDLAPLPRDRAIGRIAKWDEFRDRVLNRAE